MAHPLRPPIRRSWHSWSLAGTWLILAAGTALLAAWLLDQPATIALAMDSDMLMPLSFLNDAAHATGAWWGHELPRLPSLVPDMPVLAVLFVATDSAVSTIALYGMLQLMAFVAIGGWLAARLARASVPDGCAIFFLLFVALAALNVAARGQWVILNALLPFTHFGPLLATLLGGWLAAVQASRPAVWRGCALAGIASLTFLSDQMLLIEFVLPMACACVAMAATRCRPLARLAGLAAAVGGGLLAGAVALAALRHAGVRFAAPPPLTHAALARSIHDFIGHLPDFVAAHASGIAVALGLPLAGFACFGWATSREGRRDPADAGAIAHAMDAAFLWRFAAAAMLGSVVFTACFYLDEGGYRYLLALWVWPLIFLAASIARLRVLARLAPVGALAALLALIAVRAHDVTGGLRAWDSDVAACLRRLRAPLDLRAGLAGYWDALPAEVALGWSMQIDQITPDGHPYIWGNNLYWYHHARENPAAPPAYAFIVMRGLPPDLIRAMYGSPDLVEPCADTELWIWRDRGWLYGRMRARSPEVPWPAD